MALKLADNESGKSDFKIIVDVDVNINIVISMMMVS